MFTYNFMSQSNLAILSGERENHRINGSMARKKLYSRLSATKSGPLW